MKHYVLSCSISLLAASLLLPAAAGAGLPEPAYPRTRQLISLVEKAAARIERDGDLAFTEFRNKDSQWFSGDTYIFVNDTKGICLVNPAEPEMQGTSIADFRDADGKPVFSLGLAATAGADHRGWIHYLWPKPGQTKPVWKSSFLIRVTAPSGTDYIVGSGLYDSPTERLFIAQTVDQAAALIKKEGRDAFPALRSKAGPFLYGDTSVFVFDGHGTDLVSPDRPELEGQNVLDLKDADGNYIVRNIMSLLKDTDSGWISYSWPRLGQTEPAHKTSFVRKLDLKGDTLYLGAGLYRDTADETAAD